MHVCPAREIVLGDAALSPKLTESLTEGDAGGMRVLIEEVHLAMLDVGCQTVQSDLVGSALVW
jgi:hypothetical protein